MEGHGTARARELARLAWRFFVLGWQGWGDSSARITVLYRELVEREQWVSRLTFMRAYAVYQAFPGPEAVEMAVHLGHRRHGRLGGLLAGTAFILPGLILVLALAQFYVSFGKETWGFAGALYAIKPVVVAIIGHAILKLGHASLHNDALIHLSIAAFLSSLLLPISIVLVIFVLGIGYFLVRNTPGSSGLPAMALTPLFAKALSLPLLLLLPLFFFEAGMLTFGGSFTVLPFIERGAVDDFGWFSHDVFLDAVALCTLVPAPLVIVAAFLGYLLSGLPGALLAAGAVLLPAFAFTLVKPGAIIRLVENPRARDFFDGVTAAVVGLVLVTALKLGAGAIVDLATAIIGGLSFLVLSRGRINAAIVVLGAAIVGIGLEALRLIP